ncbi:MAG TPA: DEAD/DEAH box helicase family protein [Chitinophaga sp.]|uniref:DEAD/DEAH box helicase family protein n=1 Tax=Chitinophaga sp. TaxID=1869181 RepID=UPI002C8C2781|nr:DEAD/DEAH box helicase family protein [Chitinophaga sp.]HVI45897.1 DEAD/DEAH box helicase family protein [Chitinophaga sp.]
MTRDMLKSCNWSIDRDYKTGTEDEPLQFYLEGLANSSEFHLLLGYFSSAAINLLSVGFATFISKGGKMRMVINHLLSEKDKEVVEKGLNSNNINRVFDLTDVVSLGKVLDEYNIHFFECLAYLIAAKRIEIKIIKPKNSRGIAHYKSGVFSDGENKVGYKASCNFTLYGLSENLEELEAFLSWENGRSNKLIKKQLKIIDAYFSETDNDVEYLAVEDIEVAIRDKFGNKSLNELIVQEEELVRRKTSLISNQRLKQTIVKLHNDIDKIIRSPKFPGHQGARDYQIQAYESWLRNGQKGIFAMATGTGKTITSLNCLLNEYHKSENKIYHALILVPTITLVEQWEKEARTLNFQEVYKISSKIDWQGTVSTLVSTAKRIPVSFIIICTYASFVKEKFQSLVQYLPEDTIFIADEGHNLASPTVAERLTEFHLPRRIGLSATPKRIYDLEGTVKMEEFFSDKEPYTFSFSMDKAIRDKILCQYYYYPHIIRMTDEEMTDYSEISNQLAKIYRYGQATPEKQGVIERLLLKRKRIIHKA